MSLWKKGMLLASPLALLALSGCAQGVTRLGEGLKPIFLDLTSYIQSGNDMGLVYARFILFIAVYALMYYGAGKVFDVANEPNKHKNVKIIISLVLALMGTVLIPSAIILNLIQTYSFLVSVLFMLIPIIAGLYVAHKEWHEDTTLHHLLRGIMYLLLAYITATFLEGFARLGDPLWVDITGWGWWGVFFLVLWGVFQLLGAMGAGAAAGATAVHARRPFFGARPTAPAAGGRPTAGREETAGAPAAAPSADAVAAAEAVEEAPE
jgi:hypothetical protein